MFKRSVFAALLLACLIVVALLFQKDENGTPEVSKDVEEEVLSLSGEEEGAALVPASMSEHVADRGRGSETGWPTYHGGPDLRGLGAGVLSESLEVKWTIIAGGPVRQPPVASKEHVFVVTANGIVVSLDEAGAEAWRVVLDAGEGEGSLSGRRVRVEAPLSLVGDILLAGTDEGALFALEAETGAKRWRIDTGGAIRGATNFHRERGHIYVLDQETGALMCLDALAGGLVWRSESVDRSDGSPAVFGDYIVFGSCASALHVVCGRTGARLRDISIENGGGQVAGGVAIAEGRAYAGVRDGRVVCAELASGELLWSVSISEDEVFSTPAVDDAHLVVTSNDGKICALRRDTGTMTWERALDGYPTSPVIADGKVVVTADGTLYLLRLEDGKIIGERALADILSGVALFGDMIVVGGEDGLVAALGG